METKKMTYTQIQTKDALLSVLPLKEGSKELPSEIKTKAVLMGVELMNLVEKFQRDTTEMLKKLKPADFDERARKIERLKEIEANKEATQEELNEAAEISKMKPDFERDQQKLIEEYNAVIAEKSKEETEVKAGGFSPEEIQIIIETLGGGDDVEINGNKISRLRYLVMFAQNMVLE